MDVTRFFSFSRSKEQIPAKGCELEWLLYIGPMLRFKLNSGLDTHSIYFGKIFTGVSIHLGSEVFRYE